MNGLLPVHCPKCGAELVLKGIHLMCPNENCIGVKEATMIDAISHLKIHGMGESMIEDFVGHGLSNPFMIFESDCEEKLYANGANDTKNTRKVFEKIRNIRALPIKTVILLCSFRGIGDTTAEAIANKLSGNDLVSFSGLEKEAVSGFEPGEEKRNIVKSRIEFLEMECNVLVEFVKVYSGMIGVEFTGSPKPFFSSKNELDAFLINNGYKHEPLQNSTLLLTDSYDGSSSKMVTAKKKGIKIMTYEDFLSDLKKHHHD